MSTPCHTMGLVLKVKREKDVILTLLTPERGKITVIAKGARSLKGPQMALSQPFVYADFELYRRGDLYWLNTGELRETFPGIAARLDALNLAVYFCEVAAAVSEPEEPGAEVLRLLLNTLYFLSNATYPDELIKGVFEWRILQMQGLAPALGGCAGCGKAEDAGFALDIAQGELFCADCRAKRQLSTVAAATDDNAPRHEWILLSPGALSAIRFHIATPMEKMMAFRLSSEADQYDFSRAGEKFLRYHMDLDSTALRMYRQMK